MENFRRQLQTSWNIQITAFINEEVSAEVLFEITDQYIPLDTGISIGMESDVVEGDSEEMFCYYVLNDTEETIQTTLGV
ncbi:MAG: hypothetical protein LUC90_10765 [Lachnospiraceae bacterium]|nr:hypothetical protein [Lachnospiraceae bacterium]